MSRQDKERSTIVDLELDLRKRFDSMASRVLGRPVAHLTPRYVWDRVAVVVNQKLFPNNPWLTTSAVEALAGMLFPSDDGIEFGSGRSTSWFAARTNSLLSVEHSAHWASRVFGQLSASRIYNVKQLHIAADESLDLDPRRQEYIDAGLPPKDSFGYVLVDGLYRDACALRAVELLRRGGLLILDNANLYVPHQSRSPNTVSKAAPGWQEFLGAVEGWRLIWTSNGVWDTAIWIKP